MAHQSERRVEPEVEVEEHPFGALVYGPGESAQREVEITHHGSSLFRGSSQDAQDMAHALDESLKQADGYVKLEGLLNRDSGHRPAKSTTSTGAFQFHAPLENPFNLPGIERSRGRFTVTVGEIHAGRKRSQHLCDLTVSCDGSPRLTCTHHEARKLADLGFGIHQLVSEYLAHNRDADEWARDIAAERVRPSADPRALIRKLEQRPSHSQTQHERRPLSRER